MNIQYKNILIRNATKEDAPIMCNWWNDGKVMEHAGFPMGLGTSEAEIIWKLNKETDGTTRRHIIEIDNIPVGEMNYIRVSDDSCEMGIKICNTDMQNRGYGKIILSMFIKELLHTLGYKVIKLDTNEQNKRAQHVYEELGFQQIGIRKDDWRNQYGELQSSIDYELTQETFHDFT